MNAEHVEKLRAGVAGWNQWRKDNPLDLSTLEHIYSLICDEIEDENDNNGWNQCNIDWRDKIKSMIDRKLGSIQASST